MDLHRTLHSFLLQTQLLHQQIYKGNFCIHPDTVIFNQHRNMVTLSCPRLALVSERFAQYYLKRIPCSNNIDFCQASFFLILMYTAEKREIILQDISGSAKLNLEAKEHFIILLLLTIIREEGNQIFLSVILKIKLVYTI